MWPSVLRVRERLAALRMALRKRLPMQTRAAWVRERAAVAAMVEHGPVLELSHGAGRYLDICRAKGLDVVGCDIPAGSFNLPYDDAQFGTVVYSSRFDALTPDDMARAVAEFARVGREIVLSVSFEENAARGLGAFYAAIEGLFIADRQIVAFLPDGTCEMLRLRAPVWGDVLHQFDWHADGHDAIGRLSRKWCERYGIAPVDVSAGEVKAEYWTNEQIAELIETMAGFPRAIGEPNRMKTKKSPRIDGGPMTVFRTQGRDALIDGRRRANKWMLRPGRYPVLLIEA